jgi:hypothetical protein
MYPLSFSAAIINELLSVDGIIDIIEGLPSSDVLTTSGFSYGSIPIRISTLTYSEYAASGYDLEDDFDPSVTPMDAADGTRINGVITWAILRVEWKHPRISIALWCLSSILKSPIASHRAFIL